jgi:hypothetical protein
VELVERALLNSSKSGDVIADLFGGSGSTLIGCERRGRHARLMEIDPKYADSIVRRYEEYSGKQALLDGDGRTFRKWRSIAQEHWREWNAADGRSLLSRPRYAPAIRICRGCVWRYRTGRRNSASFKTRNAAKLEPGGAKGKEWARVRL